MPPTCRLKTGHQSAPQQTPYSIKIGSDPQSQHKSYHVPVMKMLMLQELHHAIWLNVDMIKLLDMSFPNQDQELNTEEVLQHNLQLSNSLVWKVNQPAKKEPRLVRLQSLKSLPG